MPSFVFLLTIVIIIACVLAFAALYFAVQNFTPGASRIKADVKKMMDSIDGYTLDLVPIHKKEFELLSHNQIKNAVLKTVTLSAKGILTSIYDEPMVAYAYKKYLGTKENSILYARTANQELVYRTKYGKTKVTFNNQALGEIREDGILYNAGTKQPMASIGEVKGEHRKVMIEKHEVARYKVNDKNAPINNRALEFVSDMKTEEEMVLLTLVVYELVREDLPLQRKEEVVTLVEE